MSVYFIRFGRYLKVGYSENPERRFRKLFAGSTSYAAPWDCPRKLSERTLLGYVSGYKDDERDAHDVLADFGVGCEFYLAERGSLAYMDRCLEYGVVISRPPLVRPGGPAPFVGQVPPGYNGPCSAPGVTAARKAAS